MYLPPTGSPSLYRGAFTTNYITSPREPIPQNKYPDAFKTPQDLQRYLSSEKNIQSLAPKLLEYLDFRLSLSPEQSQWMIETDKIALYFLEVANDPSLTLAYEKNLLNK